MKKRVCALMMAVLIFTLAFSSCTNTELRYLSLVDEISSMKMCSQTGEFTLELQLPSSDNSDGMEYKKISLSASYNAMVDRNDKLYLYMPFSVLYNGQNAKAELIYNIDETDCSIYISTAGLIDLMTLMRDVTDENTISPAVAKELKAKFGNAEYIELININDKAERAEMLRVIKAQDQLSGLFIKYIKEAFPAFDSKLISETSNGFKINLDPKIAYDFTMRLVQNVSDNRELVWEKTAAMLKNYEEIMFGKSGGIGLEIDKDEAFEELDSMIETMEQSKLLIDQQVSALDGSQVSLTVNKQGSSYVQNVDIKAVYEGETMFTMKGKSTVAPVSKVTPKVVDKEKTVSIEELIKQERILNPVKEMELSWYQGETEGYAYADFTFKDDSTDSDEFEFRLVEGRMYLPLRQIAELFGETVQWDATSRKAYVIRGEEKIDMTGKIFDGKTFIKIRDFEKLGYQIAYEQGESGEESYITIEKPIAE